MNGICCSCQSSQLVMRDNTPVPADYNWSDDPYGLTDSEENLYVMAAHQFPGTNMPCNGEGTNPQALIKAK